MLIKSPEFKTVEAFVCFVLNNIQNLYPVFSVYVLRNFKVAFNIGK
jgi:hypothetical protein